MTKHFMISTKATIIDLASIAMVAAETMRTQNSGLNCSATVESLASRLVSAANLASNRAESMPDVSDLMSEGTYSLTDEHRSHPLADWRYEVANGDTARGYDEWVKVQIEAEMGDD